MKEGFTSGETLDYIDSLRRRGNAFGSIPPVRPPLSWSTMSGYPDKVYFFSALARSWPMFPRTGDALNLLKGFAWSRPVILMSALVVARPYEDIH
jgi:hypothetical protein